MLGKKLNRRQALGGVAAGLAFGSGLNWRPVRAAEPVQILANRYPAIEAMVKKMQEVPGADINPQLMPFDRLMERLNISLSAKASTVDIFTMGDGQFVTFVKSGWLRQLDDVWARYKTQYNLDDFADAAIKPFMHEGHVYAVPNGIAAMIFFYRKDLFDEKKIQPPKTIQEYIGLTKTFNSPQRAGTVSCLKPIDPCISESHWYMNTIGQGWFDDKWKPIFNNARGVEAIEALKTVVASAQRGYTAAANDECTIALQQDGAAMGLQWVTRASAMDNPTQSRVVGKFDWAAVPSGAGRITPGAWAISAFSKQDPDMLFRLIAECTSEATLRDIATINLPPRRKLLTDPVLSEKNRFYPATAASLETALPFPQLAEFYAVSEFMARGILQAVTGEAAVKTALDTAAKDTETYLKGRGYY